MQNKPVFVRFLSSVNTELFQNHGFRSALGFRSLSPHKRRSDREGRRDRGIEIPRKTRDRLDCSSTGLISFCKYKHNSILWGAGIGETNGGKYHMPDQILVHCQRYCRGRRCPGNCRLPASCSRRPYGGVSGRRDVGRGPAASAVHRFIQPGRFGDHAVDMAVRRRREQRRAGSHAHVHDGRQLQCVSGRNHGHR